jgi:replicative DNA helicase
MSAEETLHDVDIREQQLQSFILHSPEYLKRADQELKRQVTMLYLAIALLLVFQGLFTFRETGALPFSGMVLMSVTSVLAIVNCLLLIKTKTWLNRLNEAWLGPQEKVAITSLRFQRQELQTRLTSSSAESENAELN